MLTFLQVLAFVDGTNIRMMLPSQDHKRHLDGDAGANTGGMGAYCPCPLITQDELVTVQKKILQKAVDGLKEEKIPFIGKYVRVCDVCLLFLQMKGTDKRAHRILI